MFCFIKTALRAVEFYFKEKLEKFYFKEKLEIDTFASQYCAVIKLNTKWNDTSMDFQFYFNGYGFSPQKKHFREFYKMMFYDIQINSYYANLRKPFLRRVLIIFCFWTIKIRCVDFQFNNLFSKLLIKMELHCFNILAFAFTAFRWQINSWLKPLSPFLCHFSWTPIRACAAINKDWAGWV